jgi:hypothetical protein
LDSFFYFLEDLSNRNRILPQPCQGLFSLAGLYDFNVTNKCKEGKSQYGPISFCGNILFELGGVKEIEECQNRVSI